MITIETKMKDTVIVVNFEDDQWVGACLNYRAGVAWPFVWDHMQFVSVLSLSTGGDRSEKYDITKLYDVVDPLLVTCPIECRPVA